MNCNTCRYELSLCLDGRLPSGRRAIVMQHVADCEACDAFWSELQAAQALTLQLPKQHVSDGFREELWQRIRAGEGTPEAVFHEPVPLATKARYLLTGAAAAAAVLLFATWLGNDGASSVDEARSPEVESVPRDARGPTQPLVVRQEPTDVDPVPMLSSAQRLTHDLVAVETARQFEQHFSLANRAIAQMAEDAPGGNDQAVRQIIDDANEIRFFGDLLLDLRDRDLVSFHDAGVEADLRVAVGMLGQNRLQKRSVDTVRSIVAPALRSNRLGNVTRTIRVQPSLDPREDQDVLVRLNTLRPEAFPKLFFMFPNNDLCEDFGLPRKQGVFLVDDQCGPSYVAPWSQVQAGLGRLRIWRSQAGSTQQVEVQIEFAPDKRK